MYAASLLYILALFLSKISVLCLIWRLSIERTHIILAQASVGITFAATLAGFLMVAFGCDAKRPWGQALVVCDSLVSSVRRGRTRGRLTASVHALDRRGGTRTFGRSILFRAHRQNLHQSSKRLEMESQRPRYFRIEDRVRELSPSEIDWIGHQ